MVKLLNELLGQRCGTAHNHLQRANVVCVCHGGFRQLQDNRWNQSGVRGTEQLNCVEERLQFESAHDNRGETSVYRHQHKERKPYHVISSILQWEDGISYHRHDSTELLPGLCRHYYHRRQ